MTTLYIKNMVCDRCKMVVRDQLESLGLSVEEVTLGEAKIREDQPDMDQVAEILQQYGFELAKGEEQQLVEKIKVLLLQFVDELENREESTTLSGYLTSNIPVSYSKISSVFSSEEGITIEKYFINLKTENLKELVSYNEQTLSEIADKLSYSSTAHLSNQFKKVTGMSVTDFKKASDMFRKPLDRIKN